MLIFDSEALADGFHATELRLAERRVKWLNRAMAVSFGVGAVGIPVGIVSAALNGLVPFFGMLLGVHDAWGNPDLIGPQLLLAVGSLVAMVTGVFIFGPRWDRAENRAKELRLNHAMEPDAGPEEFGCSPKDHRNFYESCRHCS